MAERRKPDPSGELPTERSDEPGSGSAGGTFLLVVLEGPDAGASHVIDAVAPRSTRVLVGTSPMCAFRLSDREVSRRHIALRPEAPREVRADATKTRPEGAQLLISDLGSTNGTTVNGVSLREAALRGGEVVRIGRTVISVKTSTPSASVAESSIAAIRDLSFGRVLGESLAMRRIYPLLHRAAASARPLLLEGEAGTGKELCAEEIHAHGPRSVRPLLTLESNALPADAIEERLFGDEGLVHEARGGTIFIDEVASLPMKTQRRLLAAFDTADVRFILATRRDLDRDVADRRFDEALLGELAALHIELPPLRERAGDDVVLARSFWDTLRAGDPRNEQEAEATLPADFIPRFERYAWPGNVRELLHAVRARLVLGELAPWRSEEARRRDAGDFAASVIDQELPLGEARKLVIDDFERRYVSYMITRFGNTRDAAAASGVALRYLQLLRARLLP